MSKYNTIDVWNAVYGNKEIVTDYAGRVIKKSACGDRFSSCQPTIDHVRPLSMGGSDVMENIVLCHRDTNYEKADSFPHWKTNNQSFKAVRVRGSRTAYKVVEN